jgi:cell shape-determining protein MreD
MPKTLAQWTGLAVTAIVVLGCDMDVVYAMPLGVFAGALATFFMTLADQYEQARVHARLQKFVINRYRTGSR